ncbi:LysR family transcriptional regulator [Sphingobium herbicidovorans]|jgi:DNA-binding transcriptional LysR family regulator
MPDLSLDLRHLRYALAAAQHQSFRRAAATLDVSQSTLTRRVQLLEHRIGFRIFDRGPGGVRVTSAGRLFLEEASVGMKQLGQAVQLGASVQKGDCGELHVGVVSVLASGPLHMVLREFHRRYPNIRVSLHEGSSEHDVARVMTGELDVSFVVGTPKLSGQEALLLWSESIYVALPADHRLAERDDLHWMDIREETFVVSQRGAGPEIHDYLVRKLSAPGFGPKVDVHDVSRQGLLNIVAMGYGITLASASIVGVTDGVAFRPIGGDAEKLPYSAVWSPSNSNPALGRLLRLAKDVTARRVSKVGADGVRGALALGASFHAISGSYLYELGQILDRFV